MVHLRIHPYGTALLSVGFALLFMLALDPVAMMTQSPFLLFFGAVVVSAWRGGIRSGLVATGLSVLISNYFFLEPRYSLSRTLPEGIRAVAFILECILISVLCGSLRTTNQRLDRSLAKLQTSEDSLRTANQRITDILESITDGFYTLDHRGQVAYINKQAEHVLGRSRHELLERSIWDVFPQMQGTQFEHQLHRAITEHRAIVFESFGVVNPERCFEIHINPLHDGVAVYFQDVTQRKHAEAERERLMQELETERARFEAVLQQLPAGVMIADAASGMLVLTNEQAKHILGYSFEQSLPLEDYDPVVSFEALNSNGQRYEPEEYPLIRSLRTGEVVTNEEMEIHRGDGTHIFMSVNSAPILDHHKQIVAAVTIFQDITERKCFENERKRAEAALRDREHHFSTLFNGMEDWVLVYRLTPDHLPGPFIEVNEQACRKLGYSREELLQMSVTDVIGSSSVDWERNIDQLFTEKRVFLESVHTTKDGRQIPCEVSATLFTLNGEPTVQSICRDITDRKRAAEKQREDEERLQLALWAAKASTWDWSLATGTFVCSAEYYSLYGLAPDTELTYAGWLELVHDDDRDMIEHKISEAIATQEEIRVEFRIRHRERGLRWLMLVGRHFQDENGQLVRITGITVDITERKQIEEERERLLTREQTAREAAETANRIKDEFLAVLSHELRSPLNPILGWAKLLQTRKFDELTTQRALETIERNAKLQTQLIEDLLDVSRILRGKLVLNMAPVNVATIIEAALETVQPAAEAKSIAIHVDVIQPSEITKNIEHTEHLEEANIPNEKTRSPKYGNIENHSSASATFPFRVSGDAGRLQQIMWNLLSNAVKFTPFGGRVDVRLERVDSVIQIQVHDTGKGITPAFLPYVFEYFRQEDSKTTRQFGGLGLGLAIVRHLTELHGGTIHADSPGEDLGATFTVQFPVLNLSESNQGEHSPHSLPISPSSHPLDGLKILIVDDEADMRELVFMVLQNYGAEVRVAASATDALHTLQQGMPDVLISDIGMPDVDGYMLMRQIRALPSNQGGHLPAIALTAYAGEFDHKQAIAAGFQMHLPKPVDPEDLIQAIINLTKPASSCITEYETDWQGG